MKKAQIKWVSEYETIVFGGKYGNTFNGKGEVRITQHSDGKWYWSHGYDLATAGSGGPVFITIDKQADSRLEAIDAAKQALRASMVASMKGHMKDRALDCKMIVDIITDIDNSIQLTLF